ncbi:MAG: enoyl-CoA hydratase/isomerase family protein [Candidatus Eremiobacteraeota bacterium]|nr:enoyl-CoA hydratase/isomerase family protein [Candidatus Eremiobacteraeota bacterium]
MTGDAVLLEYRDAVAWIRLNRPERMNALSHDLMSELHASLDQIDRDGHARVIVITGNGRAFCAGGDLEEFRAHVAAGRQRTLADDLRTGMQTFCRIEDSARPVIAAVNGVAVAGGLEIILCCDIVIAAQSARLGDGHLRYGVVPGGGSSVRLPRKVPRNVANRLLMTGELATAQQMFAWGLVNEVVPDAELESATTDIANRIAALSPVGLACVKRMIAVGADRPLDAALRDEIDAFESYSHRSDFLEGLQAFSEKRAPTFTGR